MLALRVAHVQVDHRGPALEAFGGGAGEFVRGQRQRRMVGLGLAPAIGRDRQHDPSSPFSQSRFPFRRSPRARRVGRTRPSLNPPLSVGHGATHRWRWADRLLAHVDGVMARSCRPPSSSRPVDAIVDRLGARSMPRSPASDSSPRRPRARHTKSAVLAESGRFPNIRRFNRRFGASIDSRKDLISWRDASDGPRFVLVCRNGRGASRLRAASAARSDGASRGGAEVRQIEGRACADFRRRSDRARQRLARRGARHERRFCSDRAERAAFRRDS